MRLEARSQDTGLAVLVRSRGCGTNFSVQEKDEASFLDRFQGDSLNAFILRFWRGLKVFVLTVESLDHLTAENGY